VLASTLGVDSGHGVLMDPGGLILYTRGVDGPGWVDVGHGVLMDPGGLILYTRGVDGPGWVDVGHGVLNGAFKPGGHWDPVDGRGRPGRHWDPRSSYKRMGGVPVGLNGVCTTGGGSGKDWGSDDGELTDCGGKR
jgi:hypothetical protein